MTKEEILKMEAGRELDALIAERIFGWKEGTLEEYKAQVEKYGEGATAFDEMNILPHYSAEIAAAWEVVKMMADQGIEVIVAEGFHGNLSACLMFEGIATPYPPKDVFFNLASLQHPRRWHENVQAETVPLAICRASLLYAEKDEARRMREAGIREGEEHRNMAIAAKKVASKVIADQEKEGA